MKSSMNHLLVRDVLVKIGHAVCDKVHHSLLTQTTEARSAVYKEEEEDTIFQIDRDVEEVLVPALEEIARKLGGIVLIAEGIGEHGVTILPADITEEEAAIRIIIDPIDGTRGIMYDKRPAFFLAGAAPNKGPETSLQDIEVAVLTELPTSKCFQSDTLWAIRGLGAHAFTRMLLTGEIKEKSFAPSRATTIIGGFSQIARFFPPGRDILAAMDDELISIIKPDLPFGKAIIFEDQYISTGGQMYEMLMGHDRFIADIRPALYRKLEREGKRTGLMCHPYDCATILIAEEAGIIVTDTYNRPLNAPLDVMSPVGFVLYANKAIYNEVQPVLAKLLVKYGLADEGEVA